jgi:hypothetical protein
MPGWRVLAIGVGVALVAGCGSADDASSENVAPTSSPTTTSPTTIPASAPTSQIGDAGPLPDAVGMDLQAAQDTMQAAGFYYLTSHDATGQGRNQVLDRNWTVCDQTPSAGSPTAPDATIDFGAVKDDEPCPR